ncbi:amino acid transporter [Macroventuria anomochaeta]|uniref:Amino acid transporter n=1 Tax=Macroventuria anomochaeta TaxID=301207 RepID=A0ACB6S8W7_9PLEO|nr:amino acid transporter [Macroventuria anomochaeta]KAF2630025.1 amino acid transporter [Macroventuria anomochaeta]
MRETMRNGPPVRRSMHPAAEDLQSVFDDFSEKPESEGDLTSNRTTSRDTETRPQIAEKRRSSAHDDDPFGDEGENEVKYRTLRWWQAGLIMIAETISLGVLSLPSVLATIGFVPGIILIIAMGSLATYTGYVLGQYKAAYPRVHNLADALEVMWGPFGREFGGAAQTIFLVFVMGSHILTFTIAMNAITENATCSIVWGVVGFVVLWIFTLPRTLKKVSYLSIASFISICGAVFLAMIALGVDPKPNLRLAATYSPSFAPAFLAVTNIIFAYAGHVAFFSFISEFRDPSEFPKALFMLQAIDITMYLVVAIVVYRYAGVDVASPALGSASKVVVKVAYGIALPTILLAGVIYGHVAAKYIYVRIFRGTRHMGSRTWLAIGSWAGITLTLWVIAWIIAESIPNFNSLLGLISALFASWFTYGMSGIFWLYLNRGNYTANWKKISLTALNFATFCIAAAICGIGLYASGKSIHDSQTGASWSCSRS